MNQFSFLIFNMLLQNCNHTCYKEAAIFANKYELVYLDDSNRIPYRSFKDYIFVKYGK